MNKYFIVGIVLVAILGLWWWQASESDTDQIINGGEEVVYEHQLITVSDPVPNSTVTSPLTVVGEASGVWFFEADFPVRIFDDNDNELGVGIATAEGEWMTEDFVPFTAEIEFSEPETPAGTIVFERDNPSDLAENDDSFSFPIQFASYQSSDGAVDTQVVSLYFYNEELDTDADGMVLCSPDSVVAFERTIPRTQSPAREVVQLLLGGDITDEETTAGLSTEYPLSGVSLADIQLSNGVLTLELNDPEFATSGGSCRVAILRSQLEKTASQFSTVQEVVIFPEDLFQP